MQSEPIRKIDKLFFYRGYKTMHSIRFHINLNQKLFEQVFLEKWEKSKSMEVSWRSCENENVDVEQ